MMIGGNYCVSILFYSFNYTHTYTHSHVCKCIFIYFELFYIHLFNCLCFLHLPCTKCFVLFLNVKYAGQKSKVGTVKGNQVRIEIVEKAVTERGIMIVGAGIVIGIMIGTVDMTVNVIEIQTIPAVMIPEVAAGHAQGQGNAPRIMIVTGTYYIL